MTKITIDSDVIGNLWKQLTGTEIGRDVFSETTYKILAPLVLLYDVRRELIETLHG